MTQLKVIIRYKKYTGKVNLNQKNVNEYLCEINAIHSTVNLTVVENIIHRISIEGSDGFVLFVGAPNWELKYLFTLFPSIIKTYCKEDSKVK